MQFNIRDSPPAIGGLALANFGMALMIYSISGRQFSSYSSAMLGFVYLFILLGICMVAIYLVRIIVDPMTYFTRDFASPAKIASVGTFAMAFCLMGKAIRINELDLPASLPATIVYIGALIQLGAMIAFLISCWKTSTWSEPYWNNAVHSCLFTAVCLGGDDKVAVVARIISISVGFVFLIPDMSIMIVRTLMPRTRKEDIVANDPNIAQMQSACSITCSGWLCSPFTGDAANGIGGTVGHVLFALSTFGFICTMTGVWQRRVVLFNFGDSPVWVATTFPFANTALAAGLYSKVHPTYSVVLSVWILIISAFAACIILSVNVMFFKHKYYLFVDTVPPATVDDKDILKLDPDTESGDTSSQEI